MKKIEFYAEQDKAMEGRGKDGDAQFHREAWGTTEEVAKADLDALNESEIQLLENQLGIYAALDAAVAVRGYKRLLEKFPQHERAAIWQKKLDELEGKK